jgi:hypothetical protein
MIRETTTRNANQRELVHRLQARAAFVARLGTDSLRNQSARRTNTFLFVVFAFDYELNMRCQCIVALFYWLWRPQ